MLKLLLLSLTISVVLIAGCGQIDSNLLGGGDNHMSPQPEGMYVDNSTGSFLKEKFDELKACGNFKIGSFEELSVVIMPPRFPCRWYEGGCGGEFLAPNSIKISNHYYWKHELIHFFLYKATGKPDTNHESDLYERCS